MSSTDTLQHLRETTVNKEPITLLKGDGDNQSATESIKEASHVKFGVSENIYSLDELTNFYNEDKQQTLKAVIFCWLHDKSSIVDYKNECLDYGIADFKFLVKTELTTWLNGSSDTCTFIRNEGTNKSTGASSSSNVGNASKADAVDSKKHKLDDPQIDRISQHEKESIDHNAALRGSKNIDFGYLVSDAKKFISQLKRAKPSSSSTQNGSKSNGPGAPKKQPIIIVSPASTSLIALNNIKEFLEDSKFVEPSASSNKKPANGIVTIHHKSERLISSAQNIMVVDNVDMFTKPEYWDRVVAIFTTGQTWQFAKYKYSKPEHLFQRYAGFYVSYHGDVTPKQIKDWNVTELKIDRSDKRFRDKMVVRDFWADIEKVLIAKGYGKQ